MEPPLHREGYYEEHQRSGDFSLNFTSLEVSVTPLDQLPAYFLSACPHAFKQPKISGSSRVQYPIAFLHVAVIEYKHPRNSFQRDI